MTTARAERFRAIYDAYYSAVIAYARRRCANDADAYDLVADTFAVAWRRLDDVPAADGARPWLYAVARRCLANQARGNRRRLRLVERLEGVVEPAQDAPTEPQADADDRAAVRAALEQLREDDREVLRLAAWEELPHAEIAVVLGCSVNAVAIRLHRARRRFAAVYSAPAKDPISTGQETGEAPEEPR